MIQIAPSILSCDFARLGEEAAAIQTAGGRWLHVDVMDGHFVPNISLGVPVVASLRKATNLFLDVHLMISSPASYVEAFAKAGSDSITIHVESEGDPATTLDLIHRCGAKAAICISPDTPVEAVFPYLDQVEMVLVMTVRPGFGGQSFMADMLPKLDALVAERTRRGLAFQLQLDGGINTQTIGQAVAHGAQILVAGSAVFNQPDYKAAIEELLRAAQGGLE